MSERRRPNITWIARGAGAFLGLFGLSKKAEAADFCVAFCQQRGCNEQCVDVFHRCRAQVSRLSIQAARVP